MRGRVGTWALGAAFGAGACEAGPPPSPCFGPDEARLEASLATPPPTLRADAAAPVPLALNLPFEAGTGGPVTQGPDGGFSHTGAQRFAWDFAVPVGTDVVAAADGIVALTADGSDAFGEDPSFRDLANRVVIDHGAGLFTAYVHLDAGGVLVAPGERVAAGDLLGWTGLSGQLTGPHLHFHVENLWSETLPARFRDPETGACDLLLGEGDVACGAAVFPAGRDTAPSEAPPETFAVFGVHDLRGLPGRHFERDRRYAFSGRAEGGYPEVAFLRLPERGGAAVLAARFEVRPDGTFDGGLVIDAPPGTYGWALTVADDRPAQVDRTVRCSVTE